LNFRFRPSKPKAPWAPATFYATNYSAECLQSALYTVDGKTKRDEDCLYLNIWYPAKPKQLPLPVLFWVYGGAFIQGAASRPEVGNMMYHLFLCN
jgi:carboxylesterase type B